MTLTWGSIANPAAHDWIGVYQAGAGDRAWSDYVYETCTRTPPAAGTSAGSCTYQLPSSLPLGTYEFRLFANNGWTKLAASGTLSLG